MTFHKKAIAVYSIFVCVLLFGCQSTPKDNVVNKKGDLQEYIAQQADPETDTSFPGEARLKFEKTYDSGNMVSVDAELLLPESIQAPVVSLREKPFVSGDALQQVVRALYPNAAVYDHNRMTKTDIEKKIIFYKELLFREENNLDLITGAPRTVDDSTPAFELSGDPDSSMREQLQSTIEKFEADYKTAPSDSDLPQTDYVLNDAGGSYQINLRIVDDNDIATIDFVNWDVGSNLYINLPKYDQSDLHFSATYQLPRVLSEDSMREMDMLQQTLDSMGVDYMILTSICVGAHHNTYYFVRSVNGFPETYVSTYYGTRILDEEGYPVMNLWTQEYMEVVVQDGKIVSLKWQNPSEIIQIDNDNAKILPWDKVEQVFKKQLDRMLTPTTFSQSGEPTTIHINRIELGLTKLLVPNSGSYKLIPTWSFLGYDEAQMPQAVKVGAEICFITINALDGSIVDRGDMY